MFRLRNLATSLWYKSMDEDIIWTEYKNRAFIFASDKREFWLDDGELEIVPLEEDEVMTLGGMERLPGF